MLHLFEEQDDPEEAQADLTEALPIRSKRTERKKKKQQKRVRSESQGGPGLLDLPYELLSAILLLLRPSELAPLLLVSKSLYHLIRGDEELLARQIIQHRYSCLEKCFRLPALVPDADPEVHEALLANAPQQYYQHIQCPDPTVCTCLSCLNRWNCLCVAVDFHHWQDHLEKGQPINVIPRGTHPEWNRKLVARNAKMVMDAIASPLTYAAILERHLHSITLSIRRHGQNKYNKRLRFRMTDEDVRAGTDAFLERSGPQALEFPYHRDNYYLLEAFLPNRSSINERSQWVYMPADQHEKDVKIAVMW